MSVVDQVFSLFLERGQGAYFGEAVTETDHALQAAHLAEKSGATANWLPPRFCMTSGICCTVWGKTSPNRAAMAGTRKVAPPGSRGISRRPSSILFACMSPPSVICVPSSPVTLLSCRRHRGSALACRVDHSTSTRCEAFEREPWFRSAVAVRRWDDAAKVPDLAVPGLGTLSRASGISAVAAATKDDHAITTSAWWGPASWGWRTPITWPAGG